MIIFPSSQNCHFLRMWNGAQTEYTLSVVIILLVGRCTIHSEFKNRKKRRKREQNSQQTEKRIASSINDVVILICNERYATSSTAKTYTPEKILLRTTFLWVISSFFDKKWRFSDFGYLGTKNQNFGQGLLIQRLELKAEVCNQEWNKTAVSFWFSKNSVFNFLQFPLKVSLQILTAEFLNHMKS